MSQAGYEHLLQQKIIPDLEKGRPNWDGPHTLAVVDFMKQIIENSPELKLDKDVEFLLTPGHAEDHVSLVVNTKQGKVVIAGDAMANQNLSNLDKKPFLCNDLIAYDKSRQKILTVADLIIPGHGDIFTVAK